MKVVDGVGSDVVVIVAVVLNGEVVEVVVEDDSGDFVAVVVVVDFATQMQRGQPISSKTLCSSKLLPQRQTVGRQGSCVRYSSRVGSTVVVVDVLGVANMSHTSQYSHGTFGSIV